MEKPLGMKFREKEEEGEEGEEDGDGGMEQNVDENSGDEEDNNLPDNMNIDGDDADKEDGKDVDDEGNDINPEGGDMENNDENPEDSNEKDNDEDDEANKALMAHGGNQPENENNDNPDIEPEPEAMEVADQNHPDDDNAKSKPPVHGVHSLTGKDSILNPPDEDEEQHQGESSSAVQNDLSGGGTSNKKDGQGDSGDLTTNYGNNESDPSAASESQQKKNRKDPPNPFMSKGDIQKKWFRRLNMAENDDDGNLHDKNEQDEDEDSDGDGKGENSEDKPLKNQYEFSDNKNDKNTEQVLGNVDANEAVQIPESGEIEPQEDVDKALSDTDEKVDEKSTKRVRQEDQEEEDKHTSAPQSKKKRSEKFDNKGDSEADKEDARMDEDDEDMEAMASEDDMDDERDLEDGDDNFEQNSDSKNELVPIHTNRQYKFSENLEHLESVEEDSEELKIESQKIIGDVGTARTKWQQHRIATEAHAIRLAEQLRLILEPTLATRLQGDYRTGKRINMRKVIPYIASGFRKDKIWLRRTKPAKRDYQVMLLIDDSKSMGAAGKLALSSLALLSTAMTRLEIGELCVASFAEKVNILHSFGVPFTEESGAQVVSQFGFGANYTRLGESLQSIVPIFTQARDSLSSSNDSAILQLCFVISDARIDTDNRAKLESTIRKMSEQHILVVLVIIDCNENPRDSIFNTKTVSFVGDKVVTKSYFDSFPFPYYVAIQNLQALPEVLADALKQWFELIRLQMNN